MNLVGQEFRGSYVAMIVEANASAFLVTIQPITGMLANISIGLSVWFLGLTQTRLRLYG